jgi:hypothetical protein
MCHDLVGAAGAISNGAELLGEGAGDFLSDISKLIEKSSEVLSNRLKFFRVVFGLTNEEIKDISKTKTLIDDYLDTIGSEKTKFDLDIVSKNENISAKSAKYIMLISMFCGDVMPKGGIIKININEKQNQESLFEDIKNDYISVNVKSDMVRIPETAKKTINDAKTDNIDEIINSSEPKTAPILLLLVLSLKDSLNVVATEDDNGFSFLLN